MANHVSSAYVIKVKEDGYAMGDSFWPTVTDNIIKAARPTLPKDAKAYIKTAVKRLKMKDGDLKAVSVDVEYNEKFEVISVREKAA